MSDAMHEASRGKLAGAPRATPASRSAQVVGLALVLALGACSRRSSELQASASGKPSIAPSAGVTPLPSAKPSSTSKLPPAPVTPSVPPQLVACAARDVYRITWDSLQMFELAAEPPPPQIRGSRVARQTNQAPVAKPLNVILAARKSVLVIAKDGLFRYEAGQKDVRRYAPIPASAPLVAWPDPRHADSFRVRSAGDEKLRDYSLAGLASVAPDAAPVAAQSARRVVDLPGFDARLFTLLRDGTPFYSTANGLVRGGRESQKVPFPEPAAAPVLLFADSAPDRHWTADAAGRLALWDQKQPATPVFTGSVPGVVIDAAQEGQTVAVLSIELKHRSYVPTVTVFSNGKEQARVDMGPSFTRQPPEIDLCLIPGRPWLLVGGRRWLQLLDWQSRRLLAEW
jgi:hypothetical protein